MIFQFIVLKSKLKSSSIWAVFGKNCWEGASVASAGSDQQIRQRKAPSLYQEILFIICDSSNNLSPAFLCLKLPFELESFTKIRIHKYAVIWWLPKFKAALLEEQKSLESEALQNNDSSDVCHSQYSPQTMNL